ncbi:MAG: 2-oxo acid dehydrogenase subunit E2 [Eubacterium ramulus]
MLVYAASKALQKFPGINSSLVDGNIVTYKSTNIGVAVAGDNGLIVPVIKNVQEKTLTAISEENRDLVDRAKEGHLKPEEYFRRNVLNFQPWNVRYRQLYCDH